MSKKETKSQNGSSREKIREELEEARTNASLEVKSKAKLSNSLADDFTFTPTILDTSFNTEILVKPTRPSKITKSNSKQMCDKDEQSISPKRKSSTNKITKLDRLFSSSSISDSTDESSEPYKKSSKKHVIKGKAEKELVQQSSSKSDSKKEIDLFSFGSDGNQTEESENADSTTATYGPDTSQALSSEDDSVRNISFEFDPIGDLVLPPIFANRDISSPFSANQKQSKNKNDDKKGDLFEPCSSNAFKRTEKTRFRSDQSFAKFGLEQNRNENLQKIPVKRSREGVPVWHRYAELNIDSNDFSATQLEQESTKTESASAESGQNNKKKSSNLEGPKKRGRQKAANASALEGKVMVPSRYSLEQSGASTVAAEDITFIIDSISSSFTESDSSSSASSSSDSSESNSSFGLNSPKPSPASSPFSFDSSFSYSFKFSSFSQSHLRNCWKNLLSFLLCSDNHSALKGRKMLTETINIIRRLWDCWEEERNCMNNSTIQLENKKEKEDDSVQQKQPSNKIDGEILAISLMIILFIAQDSMFVYLLFPSAQSSSVLSFGSPPSSPVPPSFDIVDALLRLLCNPLVSQIHIEDAVSLEASPKHVTTSTKPTPFLSFERLSSILNTSQPTIRTITSNPSHSLPFSSLFPTSFNSFVSLLVEKEKAEQKRPMIQSKSFSVLHQKQELTIKQTKNPKKSKNQSEQHISHDERDISGFSALFLLCCQTLSVVSEKKQQLMPSTGIDEQSQTQYEYTQRLDRPDFRLLSLMAPDDGAVESDSTDLQRTEAGTALIEPHVHKNIIEYMSFLLNPLLSNATIVVESEQFISFSSSNWLQLSLSAYNRRSNQTLYRTIYGLGSIPFIKQSNLSVVEMLFEVCELMLSSHARRILHASDSLSSPDKNQSSFSKLHSSGSSTAFNQTELGKWIACASFVESLLLSAAVIQKSLIRFHSSINDESRNSETKKQKSSILIEEMTENESQSQSCSSTESISPDIVEVKQLPLASDTAKSRSKKRMRIEEDEKLSEKEDKVKSFNFSVLNSKAKEEHENVLSDSRSFGKAGKTPFIPLSSVLCGVRLLVNMTHSLNEQTLIHIFSSQSSEGTKTLNSLLNKELQYFNKLSICNSELIPYGKSGKIMDTANAQPSLLLLLFIYYLSPVSPLPHLRLTSDSSFWGSSQQDKMHSNTEKEQSSQLSQSFDIRISIVAALINIATISDYLRKLMAYFGNGDVDSGYKKGKKNSSTDDDDQETYLHMPYPFLMLLASIALCPEGKEIGEEERVLSSYTALLFGILLQPLDNDALRQLCSSLQTLTINAPATFTLLVTHSDSSSSSSSSSQSTTHSVVIQASDKDSPESKPRSPSSSLHSIVTDFFVLHNALGISTLKINSCFSDSIANLMRLKDIESEMIAGSK
ncbi:uncharacterized protein MONOS_3162 [Monocercomonoides exilis]|uniref:uncharacterized protein n=1 Tax=Monocercomonoides exilis TaxID=2049356 RepID=UPI003559E701|nr:hypothetical protein MONOS_3162 [Monocercomonoides exilis]|eukprot:MONOS_3162.1-p1 / transcript=MONOS_3162.1 / gene=MONOS_3162 / organism=Monocercomonoides_exilis_PA203 / gene_product=unspecified product / transcript_product=unspecified product / location=Mono_scaffold00072:58704-62900(+) / protein_length=1399 / sequence_SO=supercontig / SO=protein_coding / is_pseudo=false